VKLLLCHNHYRGGHGGEDQVFAAERDLLRQHGHAVVTYTRHNSAIDGMSRLRQVKTALWNTAVYHELRALLRRERPDVMHCTNIFLVLSPASYAAARDEGVPVVQSLHNYRLLCPKAQFVRDGRVCESCLGKTVPWPSVWHACYRDSRAASGVVAAMLALHRGLGTWLRDVDRYIALSEFSRRKFIAGGLPADKIALKPNFLPVDPGPGRGAGGYAIYVGRLSPEKGVTTLLEAWARVDAPIPLKIVGDGPLTPQVREAAARDERIHWIGHRPHAEVLDWIGDGAFLVFPSNCYETFGLSIAEAFAKSTPVIASRLGAMEELVTHGQTGLHFAPGDAADLADRILQLWEAPELREHLRVQARREFENHYTADRNYQALMAIYADVLGRSIPPARQPVLET
jgi:glycosyltransferase involved in cell wall biosynthesis